MLVLLKGLVVVSVRQIRPARWTCCVTVVYDCAGVRWRRPVGSAARKGRAIVVRGQVAQSFPCDGPQMPLAPSSTPLQLSLPPDLLEACPLGILFPQAALCNLLSRSCTGRPSCAAFLRAAGYAG